MKRQHLEDARSKYWKSSLVNPKKSDMEDDRMDSGYMRKRAAIGRIAGFVRVLRTQKNPLDEGQEFSRQEIQQF